MSRSNPFITKDDVKPYKCYRAILRQTGTGNPTSRVLENSLGADISFVRASAGNFTIVASNDVFRADRTFFKGQAPWTSVCAMVCVGGVNSGTDAFMFTLTETGGYTDFAGDLIFLEILIYP